MNLTADKINKALKSNQEDPRKTTEQKHMDQMIDSKFFQKLRLGTDQYHEIDIVGEGNAEDIIMMRILSVREKMDIDREAYAWFGSLTVSEQKLGNLLIVPKIALLTLKKALSSYDSKSDYQYYANDETLERLPSNALKLLMAKYEDLEAMYNPDMDTMSKEEYNAYVEAFQGKPEAARSLPRTTLANLCINSLQETMSLRDNLSTLLSQETSAA